MKLNGNVKEYKHREKSLIDRLKATDYIKRYGEGTRGSWTQTPFENLTIKYHFTND